MSAGTPPKKKKLFLRSASDSDDDEPAYPPAYPPTASARQHKRKWTLPDSGDDDDDDDDAVPPLPKQSSRNDEPAAAPFPKKLRLKNEAVAPAASQNQRRAREDGLVAGDPDCHGSQQKRRLEVKVETEIRVEMEAKPEVRRRAKGEPKEEEEEDEEEEVPSRRLSRRQVESSEGAILLATEAIDLWRREDAYDKLFKSLKERLKRLADGGAQLEAAAPRRKDGPGALFLKGAINEGMCDIFAPLYGDAPRAPTRAGEEADEPIERDEPLELEAPSQREAAQPKAAMPEAGPELSGAVAMSAGAAAAVESDLGFGPQFGGGCGDAGGSGVGADDDADDGGDDDDDGGGGRVAGAPTARFWSVADAMSVLAPGDVAAHLEVAVVGAQAAYLEDVAQRDAAETVEVRYRAAVGPKPKALTSGLNDLDAETRADIEASLVDPAYWPDIQRFPLLAPANITPYDKSPFVVDLGSEVRDVYGDLAHRIHRVREEHKAAVAALKAIKCRLCSLADTCIDDQRLTVEIAGIGKVTVGRRQRDKFGTKLEIDKNRWASLSPAAQGACVRAGIIELSKAVKEMSTVHFIASKSKKTILRQRVVEGTSMPRWSIERNGPSSARGDRVVVTLPSQRHAERFSCSSISSPIPSPSSRRGSPRPVLVRL
ncbi:hypothetical protein M885DRAFT_496966 [Pelagophyceae sp. CCMP2097]|nr:hypothetical protein M885DRAFT_496966 [Pelagophyceae sp. CCMP2097]